MATRKPVSVLPEPVGEATKTSRPAAMCGQAADCGGVGPAGKRRANQRATAGWNRDSGAASGIVPLFHQDAVTVAPPASAGSARVTAHAAARHPQHEIMGGWVRSRRPATTLARCCSISSSVATSRATS